MVDPNDFGDRYYGSQFMVPLPPDDGKPDLSEKWRPSFSDLLAIAAVILAVIVWQVQPNWEVGLPISLVVIALIIFAAIRHAGSAILRTVIATAVIIAFVYLVWSPIWRDFHQKHPTVTTSWLEEWIIEKWYGPAPPPPPWVTQEEIDAQQKLGRTLVRFNPAELLVFWQKGKILACI